VFKATLVLLGSLSLGLLVSAQQTPATQNAATAAAIPAEAVKQANPVKSSAESLDRARKWWAMDCAMCHGKDGNGKGETASDMKLTMSDFTDPATLKGRTDGELFYVIKNGNNDMPPEGDRVKVQQNWDLVNYVRWLAKKRPQDESKAQ
jgi:mono/diheme cytochrome c family protein